MYTRLMGVGPAIIGELMPATVETPLLPPPPGEYDRVARIVYEGEFVTAKVNEKTGENEIAVVTSENIMRVCRYHNSHIDKVERLTGGMPYHLLPPVMRDHKRDQADKMGYLVGRVWEGLHVRIEDGKEVVALYGVLRFIGRWAEDARNGLISTISGGIDFDSGKIYEISGTPFPAAVDAALLSGAQAPGNGGPMDEEMKKKLSAYLTGHKKMSADECEKHLSGLDKEGCDKLSAECDEHDKLSAAGQKGDGGVGEHKETPEEKEARDAKEKDAGERERLEKEKHKKDHEQLSAPAPAGTINLSAAVLGKFTALAGEIRKESSGVLVDLRAARIGARLSGLQRDAKITPAEVKKIDIAKLSAANDATVDAILSTYESREPVLLLGAMGSIKAENVAELSRQLETENKKAELRAEIEADMPSLAGRKKDKGGKAADAARTELSAKAKELSGISGLSRSVTALLEKGDLAAAVRTLQKAAGIESGDGEGGSHSGEKQLSALVTKVAMLQNRLEELVKLVVPA